MTLEVRVPVDGRGACSRCYQRRNLNTCTQMQPWCMMLYIMVMMLAAELGAGPLASSCVLSACTDRPCTHTPTEHHDAFLTWLYVMCLCRACYISYLPEPVGATRLS
jgi:hypothetical protein